MHIYGLLICSSLHQKGARPPPTSGSRGLRIDERAAVRITVVCGTQCGPRRVSVRPCPCQTGGVEPGVARADVDHRRRGVSRKLDADLIGDLTTLSTIKPSAYQAVNDAELPAEGGASPLTIKQHSRGRSYRCAEARPSRQTVSVSQLPTADRDARGIVVVRCGEFGSGPQISLDLPVVVRLLVSAGNRVSYRPKRAVRAPLGRFIWGIQHMSMIAVVATLSWLKMTHCLRGHQISCQDLLKLFGAAEALAMQRPATGPWRRGLLGDSDGFKGTVESTVLGICSNLSNGGGGGDHSDEGLVIPVSKVAQQVAIAR